MKLNFCPECAQPLQKLDDTHYVCPQGHDYWNNPRATVAVILLKDGKILMSKRGREPSMGMYDLPGGFLEYGEDALEGAKREIAEETGMTLDTADLEIIAAYTGFYSENESITDMIILAKKWQGEPVAADDSEALEWQPLEFIYSEQSAVAQYYTGLVELLQSKL